jgi:hypothetical protein
MLNKGFEYEEHIFSLMAENGFVSKEHLSKKTAGSDNTQPDMTLFLNGQNVNLEVKKSLNSQAGGTSLKYTQGNFYPVKSIEGVCLEKMNNLLDTKVKSIEDFLEFHKANTFPFSTTKKRWKNAVEKGLLKKINCKIECDSSFIESHYNRKNTYYIHIGNKGLYYMTKDIANLGVPKLDASVCLEIRAARNGSKLNSNGVRVCAGTLRVQARIKDIKESLFSLENISSIERFKLVV